MIIIDGSFGEGGGQIVRSSLALAMVTGKAVTIENLRAGRKRPGLMRQHLTALAAAREVSDAETEGERIGSTRIVFRPQAVRAGEYHFRVGTAGSTTLIFQTILPALLTAETPSTVVLEGGTHNPFAPPFDFLEKSYLRLIERLGPKITSQIERYGFYPAGGGKIRFTITPRPLGHLELTERGTVHRRMVRALVSNLPENIAHRECHAIKKLTDWDRDCFSPELINGSPGPGNVVMIEVETEHLTELFIAQGKQGVRAENVAKEAYKKMTRWVATGQPVGEHLADQLLLPLAIGAHRGTGGGRFTTGPLTMHSKTHIEVIRRFLDVAITTDSLEDGNVLVHVQSS